MRNEQVGEKAGCKKDDGRDGIDTRPCGAAERLGLREVKRIRTRYLHVPRPTTTSSNTLTASLLQHLVVLQFVNESGVLFGCREDLVERQLGEGGEGGGPEAALFFLAARKIVRFV